MHAFLIVSTICTLIWKQPTSYGLPSCLYSCVLPCCLVALTGNGRTKAQQIIVYPARSEAREPSSFYFSSSMGRNLISLVIVSSW